MLQKRLLLTLFLALVLAACNLPTVRTATPALPASTSGPAALTFDLLRNATYFGPFYHRTVTLTDGSFFVNTDTDKYSVMMLEDRKSVV